MLTDDDLSIIEARAALSIACPTRVETGHDLDRYRLTRDDVPALIAEIRRLRSCLRLLLDAAGAASAGEIEDER